MEVVVNMSKVYAIIGPTASGKTAIISELKKLGLHEIKRYTTATTEDFSVEEFKIVSEEEFNNIDFFHTFHYENIVCAFSKLDIIKAIQQHPISLIQIDKAGLNLLYRVLGEKVESIYIMLDPVNIVQRLLEKNIDTYAIQLKLNSAEKAADFSLWENTDHIVKNTADLDLAVKQVLAIMGFMKPKI